MTTPTTREGRDFLEWYGFHQLDCKKEHNPEIGLRWLEYEARLESRSARVFRRSEDVDNAHLYICEYLRENNVQTIPLHIHRLANALYPVDRKSRGKVDIAADRQHLTELVEDMREQVILRLLAGAEKAAGQHNAGYKTLWQSAVHIATLTIPEHTPDRNYSWVGSAYEKLKKTYQAAPLRAVA